MDDYSDRPNLSRVQKHFGAMRGWANWGEKAKIKRIKALQKEVYDLNMELREWLHSRFNVG